MSELICGVDEAGRGPVIGSLFIAGYMCKEDDLPKLKAIGVKDSKLLTHKKRLKIYEELKKISRRYKIIKVEPKEIDEAVESDVTNLNWLEAKKTAEIINYLKPDRAYIDCPSPNKEKYKNYLRNLLENKEVELIVEHKADVKFTLVGAASIVAKCNREEEVAKIEKTTKQSIGTGYVSNPICQKFLKENWDKYPDIFRKSWISWKNHHQAKQQKRLEEF